MTDAEIKRLLRVCIDINNLSIDQSRLFVAAEYVPLPKQAAFHRACRECDKGIVTDVLQGGGRGGGKTSAAVAQAVFDDMTRFPGLKALFLRSVVKAAKESFDDKVNKMIKIPHDRTGDRVTLPNGSFILFGGFGDRNDITKYQGNEYDLIIVEEATFFKELTIDMINGSLRSTRSDGWKPRMYLTANPGGIGHKWVKSRFVDTYYGNREEETRYIHSTYQDNNLLDANYIKKLEGYSGNLRKSWTLGDWNLDEGIAFAFDEDIHAINDMQLWEHSKAWAGIYPEHQSISAVRLPLRGVDDGFRAPYAALWGMYNPLIPRVIIYREDYGAGYTNAEQAERIKSLTPPHEAAFPWTTYADPAMFGKKSLDLITSPADIYADHGVYLTRGDNQRSHGKRKIDSLLQIKSDGLPGLLIHKSCTHTIDQFKSLIYDDDKLEDVDTDQEDHCFVAGTMILTDKGEKPIENIKPMEMVLTRDGYRPVLWAYETRNKSQIYELAISNGRYLTGTANHPVYVEGKGFTRLDEINIGDELCANPSLFTTKESDLTDIQNQKDLMTGVITDRTENISSKVLGIFTKKYGKIITNKKYRKDSIFTILTGITRTMISAICNVFMHQNTYQRMENHMRPEKNTWIGFRNLPKIGINLRKGMCGIVNMQNEYFKIAQWLIWFAKSVAVDTRQLIHAKINRGFVPLNAKLSGVETQKSIMKSGYALSAEKNIQPINMIQEKLAHENAVHVTGKRIVPKEKVYNLTVAITHEYYANGVLVSNCYDATRYLLSGVRDKAETEPIKETVRNPLMDLFPS